MPDLTVIVPTYNGRAHLRTTLDSLTRQTEPVHVIVVDDGSTDGTPGLARQHAVVAQVLIQENAGVAVARNRGLAHAATPFVAFLDQDDMWHPSRAESLLQLAANTGRAAVGTTEQAFALESDRATLASVGDGRDAWPAQWIATDDEASLLDGNVGGSNDVEELTVERFMRAPLAVTTAFMYDREAAISAGGCATFIKAADDHVLNVNMAKIFGPIARLDRPSLFYRVHPASTTTTSPLVAPYLTTLLALRHGRSLPSDPVESDYVDHLLWQMPKQTHLPVWERLSLLALTVPPNRRVRWLARWTKAATSSKVRPRR